jgi:hypothetical protein
MKSRLLSYSIAVLIVFLMIAGCGGSGSSPNPPVAISVSFSPQPPASLDAGTSTSVTATVSNDSANAGVTWKVSCGSALCGSIAPASTASGVAATYSAPATAPSPATVTIVATSVTDGTKSATATLTITSPSVPIAVAITGAPSSVAATTTATFTATVSNDSANAGVNWTVSCGSAACGSFTPSLTASGAATTYTAPAAVPAPATVTITATSVSDHTKSASVTVTITAAPPVLADGNYVFHVSGYDGTSPYFVAGAFTVSSGLISGGEQDMTDADITVNDAIGATGSGLSVVNGNIQIVLNTGDTAIGVNGIETFRGTVVSGARVLIEEYDSFATATGSLDAQTSTASPAGGYAFNLGGLDGSATPNWLVMGGVLNINGASISTAGSVLDIKDGASMGQKQGFSAGTVSAPDAYGRVVLMLTPASTPALNSFAVAAYPVSTSQMQLVETQDALSGDLGGTALGQGANTGSFTQASVAGKSYAFGANGQDYISSNNGPKLFQVAGGLALNGDSTVSGAMAWNDLNFHFGANVTSGSYTVDATGRVTVTATVTSGSLSNNPTFLFQLYLDGNGNALELGIDSLQASAGLSYVQQAPSSDFEGSYAMNVYGYSGINSEPAWSAAGPVTISADVLSGYSDYSLQNASNSASAVTPNVTLTGTESSGNGVLHVTGLYAGDQPGPPQTSNGFGYYPIDTRRVLAIEIDGQQLGLMMLEGLQPN